ncbi:MAG TPA: DEAD/DEAH box helicase, partial [Amycolatopsis sp.]
MEFGTHTQATYVPSDPPRDGVLALWGDEVAGDTAIELVLPSGGKFARTKVSARLVPLARAIPRLLVVPDDASPALTAWSAAVNAGVNLVARGRLRPAVTPGGVGSWRVGPLDAADEALLRDLAAALPPEAHALPLSGVKRIRLHSPESLVRALWDAAADVLVRSPAAPVGAGGPAFAEPEPTLIGPDGAAWLTELETRRPHGVQLILRVEAREGGDEPEFAGVLAVRSTVEPSLIVEAAMLWDAPEAVLHRLGDQVETQLLLGLRRGARAWAPLGRVLSEPAPTELVLTDDEVVGLLTDGSRELGGAGIEVLWPKDLFAGELKAKASATQAPASEGGPAFPLNGLLKFRWRLSLGGSELTDEEVAALAEAKRPLVRLRGQWVKLDPFLLARMRARRSRKLTGAEALAAALTGELELDGETVEFAAQPVLAGLVERLREREPEPVAPPPGLTATLRPYQLAGLGWLATMTGLGLGACLADDMGLGKTIQTLALIQREWESTPVRKRKPTLLICPMSVVGNWSKEAARFTPDLPVMVHHGLERTRGTGFAKQAAKQALVLSSYSLLHRDFDLFRKVRWSNLVLDEAQNIKNPQTKQAQAARALQAENRIALTGTPVENH